MKNKFKKVFAVVFATSVMSCFALSASAYDWEQNIENDPYSHPYNVVISVIDNVIEDSSSFIESSIIVLCVVGGFKLGTRFLKKSFR